MDVPSEDVNSTFLRSPWWDWKQEKPEPSASRPESNIFLLTTPQLGVISVPDIRILTLKPSFIYFTLVLLG